MNKDDRYPLLIYPDPRLRLVCDPVEGNITAGEVWDVLDAMGQVMKDHNGIGLAAPQIGCPRRIIVVHIPDGCLIELVNPEIKFLKRYGRFSSEEGCLSYPGKLVRIQRYRRVKVSGTDRNAEPVTFGGKDQQAAALQHEMEHLDGINIADYCE